MTEIEGASSIEKILPKRETAFSARGGACYGRAMRVRIEARGARRPSSRTGASRRRALWGLLAVAASAVPARAVCPDEPSQCLGDAGRFALVAREKAFLGVSRLSEDGFAFWAFTYVDGDVCARQVRAISPPPLAASGEPVFAANVAALATSGAGIVAKTAQGITAESVGLQTGVAATAGAFVSPLVFADQIDTSGTHPLLATCESAIAAAAEAAATLAALPATGSLGSVVLAPGENRTIELEDGVNVIDADKITLGASSLLSFDGTAPTWAIVRTRSLKTSQFADIETVAPILFLLDGRGAGVSIGPYSDLFGVAILAPERSATLAGEAYLEGLWVKKATLRGVDLLPAGDYAP